MFWSVHNFWKELLVVAFFWPFYHKCHKISCSVDRKSEISFIQSSINWNSSATSIHAGKFSLEHSNTHQRTDFRTNGNAKLFWGYAKELWAWCCDRWDVMYAITVIYITLPWIHYPQPRTHSQNIFLVGWILQSLPARPLVDIFFCNAQILKAPECWRTTHSKRNLKLSHTKTLLNP